MGLGMVGVSFPAPGRRKSFQKRFDTSGRTPSRWWNRNGTSVHSFDGVYVVVDPPEKRPSPGPAENLIDIGSTVLRYFGMTIPDHVQGQPIPNFL